MFSKPVLSKNSISSCVPRFATRVVFPILVQAKSPVEHFAVGYEAVAFEYVVEDLLKCDKNKRKRSNAEQVCNLKENFWFLTALHIFVSDQCKEPDSWYSS